MNVFPHTQKVDKIWQNVLYSPSLSPTLVIWNCCLNWPKFYVVFLFYIYFKFYFMDESCLKISVSKDRTKNFSYIPAYRATGKCTLKPRDAFTVEAAPSTGTGGARSGQAPGLQARGPRGLSAHTRVRGRVCSRGEGGGSGPHRSWSIFSCQGEIRNHWPSVWGAQYTERKETIFWKQTGVGGMCT